MAIYTCDACHQKVGMVIGEPITKRWLCKKCAYSKVITASNEIVSKKK